MSFSNKKNSKSLGWQVLNSQYIFQCPYFKLRQDTIVLPNQKKFPYTYVEHPGSVFVVPISPQREIFLIHSYRYTIDDWCWGGWYQ